MKIYKTKDGYTTSQPIQRKETKQIKKRIKYNKGKSKEIR